MIQSGVVLSPGPVTGSSLLTETIWQTGAGSQLSVADTETTTGTIWWFGCESTFGLVVTELITGAVVSATINVVVQVLLLPAASIAVTVITWLPIPTRVPAAGL